MRRKVPESIQVLPDYPQIEPLPIYVENLAELALLYQLTKVANGLGVEERVPHHEHALRRLRLGDHRVAVGHRQGERLLDEHLLAGAERRDRMLGVERCRRGQNDRVDLRGRECILEAFTDPRIRIALGARRPVRWIGLADQREIAVGDIPEVAGQLGAPIAESDEAYLQPAHAWSPPAPPKGSASRFARPFA